MEAGEFVTFTPLFWFNRRAKKSPPSLAQAAYEELRASHGTVVNISSVTSQAALPNRLAYGTTKAALDHFTRSLAVEWGPLLAPQRVDAESFSRKAEASLRLQSVTHARCIRGQS